MKLPYNQDWFSIRDVCSTLGVARSTLLRMIAEGRFPPPCRNSGLKGLWSYSVVADKLAAQLSLWLGKRLMTVEGYKPLRITRPVGMSRRDAERLLEKIEAQISKRDRDKLYYKVIRDHDHRWHQEANFNRADTISRAYAQACFEAREEGKPLTDDQRISLYRRLARPKADELKRFKAALKLANQSQHTPCTVKAVIYSEPDAALPPARSRR